MAAPHFFASMDEPVVVDLAQAFVGYTDNASYAAEDETNGALSLAGTTATFAPSACGFGAFQLSVKDGAGATMTKRYGVFIRCP